MGQALYRKYRSRSFNDVVGQDHIVKTLKNALKKGRISHAYLFTGPRGVGKTSVARILAHEVNGLKYDDESVHLDIIEIDAASNRRIDEIRDLRERVRIAPTSAKYKVYIIDEVHMLTREAFNALLKTLEEPPAHCIFILATTEAHKLPETIVSRTQRFEFKPVSQVQAAKHLGDISRTEKIDISDEALDLLAQFGNGSFRDSISYLDQLSSLDKKITEDDVRSILGLPPIKAVDELLDLVAKGNSGLVIKKLIEIEEQGVNPTAIAASLADKLRRQALSSNITKIQIGLLKSLTQVSASSRPQEALEIALLESVSLDEEVADGHEDKQTETEPQPKSPSPTISNDEKTSFSLSRWSEVLDKAKLEAASIYTALRLAEPQLSGDVLTLSFQFPLHQKKLDQTKNKDLVAKVIYEVTGATIIIETQVRPKVKMSQISVEPEIEPAGAIHSIFGGAEVMET